jgi:glucose/arabinose dehydrogenase
LLDMRARVVPNAKWDYDERGLLGTATHPNFAQHPYIYTYSSETNAGPTDFPATGTNRNHRSIIAEWRIDPANTNRVDPASRREVLRIDQPQSNHNGGTMRFGPDGFLYVALGDGGAANDVADGHSPGGNGQDTNSILGKLIRIDVDARTSPNGQYGVPSDNPFDGSNGLREIWAYGLRNPWGFSFDRMGGTLYLADVGQNRVEEIDIIVKGGNYGWSVREGTFWFNPSGGTIVTAPTRPVPPNLIDPIAQYDHDDGLAVVGGFVYRGAAIPELAGRYVFGDWGTFQTPSGRLYYLDVSNNVKEFRLGLLDRPLGEWIKGFGEGPDGELYVFTTRVVGPAGNSGRMMKIIPAPARLQAAITSVVKRGKTNDVICGWMGG